MRRGLTILLAAACALNSATGQKTNAVLVHGFLEGPSTWNYVYGQLTATGNYNPFTVGTVVSSDPIATQSSALGSFLSANSFGSNAVLVGHSQGGLVSRYATRSHSVGGLLTVASPNAGAPVAGTKWLADFYLSELALDGYLAGADLFDLNFSTDLALYQVWLDASSLLGGAVGGASIGLEAYYTVFYNRHPSIAEMIPGSGTISSLINNPGLEMASVRHAIVYDDADYWTGPWRAIESQSAAEHDTNVLTTIGWFIALDGLSIVLSANPATDPNWINHQEGGNALEDIGAVIANLPWIWNNQIVGGTPNDGLLPTAVERLPDKPALIYVVGLSHNEAVVDAGHIISALNTITGR